MNPPALWWVVLVCAAPALVLAGIVRVFWLDWRRKRRALP